MLQSMGLQRVGYDLVTELNCTESSKRSGNLPGTKQLIYGKIRVQVHDDSLS